MKKISVMNHAYFFCYFVLKDEVHQDSIEAYKLILGGGI